jgi:hypothetical protein
MMAELLGGETLFVGETKRRMWSSRCPRCVTEMSKMCDHIISSGKL